MTYDVHIHRSDTNTFVRTVRVDLPSHEGVTDLVRRIMAPIRRGDPSERPVQFHAPWTAWEEEMLGTAEDSVIAYELNRTEAAVRKQRKRLRIKPFHAARRFPIQHRTRMALHPVEWGWLLNLARQGLPPVPENPDDLTRPVWPGGPSFIDLSGLLRRFDEAVQAPRHILQAIRNTQAFRDSLKEKDTTDETNPDQPDPGPTV